MVEFRLRKNLIILEATINANRASMILDTGAGGTIVNKTSARRLGLKKVRETCTGGGAGGDVTLSAVEIELLTVGPAKLNNLKGMTMDMSDICARLEENVDGIVGYDFLSNFRVTIDYPAQQLFLDKAA